MILKHVKPAVLALLTLLIGPISYVQASDLTTETPWSPGANSRARLVAAGGLAKAISPPLYHAAIEIELKSDAHTYWRQPGDAGVPPVVNFDGSRNLKKAELRFPAPARLDEAGLQVFGYRNNVLLPLEVQPENPALPVHLAIGFSYAACAKICIPAEAHAALDLRPGEPPGPHEARIAEAIAHLPLRVSNAEVSIRPDTASGKIVWHVRVLQPKGPWRDRFAEGPEGWFIEARPTAEGFDLIAADQPKDARLPVPVTLTLAGQRDYELQVALPPP